MTKKNINIDKKLKENERYQELIGGIHSLNQQIVELEHLKNEADTERLNIEKITSEKITAIIKKEF